MKPNPNRHISGTQPIASTLGGRVRLERQRKGWTQAELASATGSTVDAIARLEIGELAMSEADLARVAAALGTTIAALAQAPNAAGMTKRGVG